MSYREQFEGKESANIYDSVQYAPESYASLLWSIERTQLNTALHKVAPRAGFAYLDFACGTGRILQQVAPLAQNAIGIEISAAMAELAQNNIEDVTIICKDITSPYDEIEGHYDVITAFRFVLNAEPELRIKALASLNTRLRDQTSRIILNNHGNLLSHKLVLFPLHKFKTRGRHMTEGNYLSHRSLTRYACQAGLKIERVAGCGLIGGRLARLLPTDLVRRLETRFARSKYSWLGSNQMYVASRI